MSEIENARSGGKGRRWVYSSVDVITALHLLLSVRMPAWQTASLHVHMHMTCDPGLCMHVFTFHVSSMCVTRYVLCTGTGQDDKGAAAGI